MAENPIRDKVRTATINLFVPGGYAEQAEAAQQQGMLPAFFASLITTLGPVVGPIIQALLAQWLHLPKVPTPTTTAK